MVSAFLSGQERLEMLEFFLGDFNHLCLPDPCEGFTTRFPEVVQMVWVEVVTTFKKRGGEQSLQ